MNRYFESLLNYYNSDTLFNRKKAVYTLQFMALITLYSITVFMVSLIFNGPQVHEFIEMTIWFLALIIMVSQLKKGRLELTINLFIIGGVAKAYTLLHNPLGLHFFIHISLVIFVIGAIHLKRYQLFSGLLACYGMNVYFAITLMDTRIIGSSFLTFSYRNSMILGVAMYILTVIYLSGIINREIVKAERLDYVSKTDFLTGLNNRLSFNQAVESLNVNESSCLMILDLDHFKNINDNFGHHIGDRVLEQFAKLLMDQANEKIHVFRMGGEEFSVLIENCTYPEAKELALMVNQRTKNTDFNIGRNITVSIGCRYIKGPFTRDLINKFYKDADENLYKAKSNGRDQIRFS